MKHQKVFIQDSEVVWSQVGEGIKRKIMAFDDKLMVVKVEFKKDSIGNLHQHFHSQITHVQSGSFEVNIDGDKKVLKSGDAFYIPPNADHGCVCLEDGVLIDVFSPIREDFINSNQ